MANTCEHVYARLSHTLYSNYANSATCQWIIAPPGATEIEISFKEFQTDQYCDIVRIYACTGIQCTGTLMIAELSGVYYTSQTIRSNTGYMLIQFTSDSSNSYSGFTASWSATTPSPTPSPTQVTFNF